MDQDKLSKKTDVLLKRIEVCTNKISDLDERINAVEVKHTQKFISDDKYEEEIEKLQKKKESVMEVMDEIQKELKALSNE